MRYRIPNHVLRGLSYLGLPLAVLIILVGQTREDAPSVARAVATPPATNSVLAELPEFQAVTDRTTELGAEEMPAYWRLMSTAADQSFTELSQQSRTDVDLDHLFETPAQFRGSAVQITLNVRRILNYEVESGPGQFKQLYEVWGWVDGAPEQLVVAVTSELPVGLPISDTVYERATVCGYFFKLQGYLPAGAEARMSPLAAPLLIGRLERRSQPQLAFAQQKDWWRIGAGALLVLSLVGSISSRSRLKKAHSFGKATDRAESAELDAWLAAQGG